jgi:rubrerythrin
MSIVGPRPLTRLDIKRLGWNQYRYISRWNIKPGITGLAQLYAGRSARISICFDLSYVKTYNLILDFKIILLTILMNVLGKKTIRRILNEKIKSRTRIMNWSKWKKYFYKNSFSKLPEIHDSLDRMNSEQKLALQKSLAIFQLGEAGEGRIAKEIYKTNIFAVNQNYRECIEYFVKEEGKHARILSKIIFTLGGRLLEKNWTEKLFSLGRRLLGIRLKLIVLLVAELVSLVFYKFYIQKLPLSGIRAALIGILKEEEKHLEFHSNFFKIRLNHFVSRNTFKILFFIISHSAFLVILLDHFRYLKKFNAGLIELYIQFLQVYDLVESKVFEREKTIDSINKFSTGALK